MRDVDLRGILRLSEHPPFSILEGYGNIPSLGPLFCKKRIHMEVILNFAYWADPSVRRWLMEAGIVPFLKTPQHRFPQNAMMIRGTNPERIAWLKHGERLCAIPHTMGSEHKTWCPIH